MSIRRMEMLPKYGKMAKSDFGKLKKLPSYGKMANSNSPEQAMRGFFKKNADQLVKWQHRPDPQVREWMKRLARKDEALHRKCNGGMFFEKLLDGIEDAPGHCGTKISKSAAVLFYRFDEDLRRGEHAELAQMLKEAGDTRHVHEIISEFEGMSLHVKRLYRKDKSRFVAETHEGELVLGFYHRNPDGSDGGFVSARCHFHDPENTFYLDVESRMLGNAIIMGGVRVTGSTIRRSGKFQNATIIDSELEDCTFTDVKLNCVKAEACTISKTVANKSHLEECTFRCCQIAKSQMKRSFGAHCSFDTADAQKSQFVETKGITGTFRHIRMARGKTSPLPEAGGAEKTEENEKREDA